MIKILKCHLETSSSTGISWKLIETLDMNVKILGIFAKNRIRKTRKIISDSDF